MVTVRGVKNFTIYRGDTFEFSCRLNLSNLITSVRLNCKSLALSKELELFQGCYYFSLSPEETAALPKNITAARYSLSITLVNGAVKTLFIDGVFELLEGSEAPAPAKSTIPDDPDPLTEVNIITPAPAFEVDIFDWIRVALPGMFRVSSLPEASDETMGSFYLLPNYTIWYSIIKNVEGVDTYLWTQLVDTSLVETLLSEKQDKLVSGENIKTVNGVSLLGSGDISLGGTSLYRHLITFNGSYKIKFNLYTVNNTVFNFTTLCSALSSGKYILTPEYDADQYIFIAQHITPRPEAANPNLLIVTIKKSGSSIYADNIVVYSSDSWTDEVTAL